jgi:hypothetical protein
MHMLPRRGGEMIDLTKGTKMLRKCDSGLTHELLAEVGQALYGPRWQTELARDLDIGDRTMRRWAAGTHPIPGRVAADLRDVAKGRRVVLAELDHQLWKALRTTVPQPEGR